MSLYTFTRIGLPSPGAMGRGAVAEWLGGVQGAPHTVLIGAIVLVLILMFWKRDLPQRQSETIDRQNKRATASGCSLVILNFILPAYVPCVMETTR
jgi:hypothetical protein